MDVFPVFASPSNTNLCLCELHLNSYYFSIEVTFVTDSYREAPLCTLIRLLFYQVVKKGYSGSEVKICKKFMLLNAMRDDEKDLKVIDC